MDLNADLGEGFGIWRLGDDLGLLEVVSSANVVCGFHAGDPSTMRRVCAAAERGVAVGAQVGYRDLAGVRAGSVRQAARRALQHRGRGGEPGRCGGRRGGGTTPRCRCSVSPVRCSLGWPRSPGCGVTLSRF